METFRDSHVHLLGGEPTCHVSVMDVLLPQGSALEVRPHLNLPREFTWTVGQGRWTAHMQEGLQY